MDVTNELKEKFSKTIGVAEKSAIISFIIENQIPLSYIFELTTYKKDPKIAFKAAWIFEEIILSNFNLFDPFILDFLNTFPQINNRSVRRHFSKILCKLLTVFFDLSKGKLLTLQAQQTIETYSFEPIIEALFDWLIDEKEKVGVKVWCIEALFYLSVKYEWIVDELELQIDFLLKEESAAIASRGRKVKELLNSQYSKKTCK